MRVGAGLTILLVICLCPGVLAATPGANETFDATLATLLVRRCIDCHSGPSPKGGLNLTTRKGVLSGGDSGPAVVPGNVEASLLWQRVRDDEMPPKKPLAREEKELLRAWIAAGANWGTDPINPFRVTTDKRAGYDWWSLRPVARPALPGVQNKAWARDAIDTFVLHRLEAKSLAPSPEADRRTLIRRLSFDLLGLPPSPEEVAAFQGDPDPSAYEKLVDRLLASPHFGERWGRHWLDVVRFGESDGFERDLPRANAWPYRDWVVAACNRDMPYDEFVRLQLAGDVLQPGNAAALAATGFLVAGPHDIVLPASERMKAAMRQDEMEDLLGTLSQTFLGLTVNCARCHDHKFDPIAQKDYYRLGAALAGVGQGERSLPNPAVEAELAVRKKLDELEAQIEKIDAPLRQAILAQRSGAHVSEEDLLVRMDRDARQARQALRTATRACRARIDKLKASHLAKVYAVIPSRPQPTHLLLRGQVGARGELLGPAGVAAVNSGFAFQLPPDAPEAERRVALARWITDAANPLCARVIVNRLWHYHFGTGLVDTPNDFGFNGGRPSHPELLDWLASELVREKWSLKVLHRHMVLSATYRQASRARPGAAKIDADNRLLWRAAPRRLEAEAIRDGMLAVAGDLDRTVGGKGYEDMKSYFFKGTQYYEPLDQVGPQFYRRTLYRFGARGGRSPFLDTFDCPDPSTTTPRRVATTTPVQALALLNNAFVLHMADRLSERLRRESGRDVSCQVARAYRLAYGRDPEFLEAAQAQAFVERHGLPAFCRVLFNSNEFVQVD